MIARHTSSVSSRPAPLAELGAWSPCAEQQSKVGTVDYAVNIQVAEAAKSSAGAGTPCAKQQSKVGTGDNAVQVEVTKAGRWRLGGAVDDERAAYAATCCAVTTHHKFVGLAGNELLREREPRVGEVQGA